VQHLSTRFFFAFPLLSPSLQPYLKLETNLKCGVKLCNLIPWRRLNGVNKTQTGIGRVGRREKKLFPHNTIYEQTVMGQILFSGI